MIRTTVLTLVLALAAPAAIAQSPHEADLRRQVDELRQQQDDLKAEVEALKKRLEPQRPSAPDVEGKVFHLGDRPYLGRADAELVLIELTDFQCPFCVRHHSQTFPQLRSEYVESGKVRYTSMDLPLASIHPQAVEAAEAARCAGEQDRYWEMRDRLFSHSRNLGELGEHAAAVGLDTAAFDACMDSDRWTKAIEEDIAAARDAGARGTPSFVLARIDPADPENVTALTFIRGAQPFQAFQKAIDDALAGDDAS